MRRFFTFGFILFSLAPALAAAQSWRVNTVVGSELYQPEGVAVDAAGNLYVADTGNNAVRKYVPSNSGFYTHQADVADGLSAPTGVAVDAGGSVYVIETGKLSRYTPSGAGAYTRVDLVTTGLQTPQGIALDALGNIYVTDPTVQLGASSSPAVYKYAPDGSGGYVQASIGGGWNVPLGIAVDAAGNVYVADLGLSAVRRYAPDGAGGYVQQANVASAVHAPAGVALAANGEVYVGSQWILDGLHRYTPDGAGGYTPQADITSGLVNARGLAVGPQGEIYVADTSYGHIRRIVVDDRIFAANFDPAPARFWDVANIFDGHAQKFYDNQPTGFTIDASGAIYVSGYHYENDPDVIGTVNIGFILKYAQPVMPTRRDFGSANLIPLRSNLGDFSELSESLLGHVDSYTAMVMDSTNTAYVTYLTSHNIGIVAPLLPQPQPVSANPIDTGIYAFDLAMSADKQYVFEVDCEENQIYRYPTPLRPDHNDTYLTITGNSSDDFYCAVAADASGNTYAATEVFGDNGFVTGFIIRKFAPDGAGGYAQQSDVGEGYVSGPTHGDVTLHLAADAAQNVFVAQSSIGTPDPLNPPAVHFFKPDGSGGYIQQEDLPFVDLNYPMGLYVDEVGGIYVANYGFLHNWWDPENNVQRASIAPPPPN